MLCTALLFLYAAAANARDRYNVSLGAVYGWNATWEHHGGVDVAAHLPINRHFEADASLEYLSPKVMAFTLSARPLFPIGDKAGALYLDGSLHCKGYFSSRSTDFVMAFSAGYRWDYVGAQIGLSHRQILDADHKWGSTSDNVNEPLDLIYNLWFNVRPATSEWNLGGGITNFSPYEFERMWQPFFFLNAHYDFLEHYRVLADVYIKESGMFHLTANFYGISTHVGFAYRF